MTSQSDVQSQREVAVKHTLFGSRDKSFQKKVELRWPRRQKGMRALGQLESTLESIYCGLFISRVSDRGLFYFPDHPQY